jgi:hypothetical protein
MRLLLATYRVLGRYAFAALLYPVAGYFCVVAGHARRASRDYLAAVRARLAELGRPVPPRFHPFHHVLAFGHAVLDKVAMWADALPQDAVAFEDDALLERFRVGGRGALFIGSHLGNLEAARAFGDKVQGMKVNALVFTRHSPKFNRSWPRSPGRSSAHSSRLAGPETASRCARGWLPASTSRSRDRVSVRHKRPLDAAVSPASAVSRGPFVPRACSSAPLFVVLLEDRWPPPGVHRRSPTRCPPARAPTALRRRRAVCGAARGPLLAGPDAMV